MADRRERKRAETRAALLDSALALVRQRGVYGTRVEDITERADVGKGVFYNYFDSKDAVVAALLSDGVDMLQRDYLAPALAREPGDRAVRVANIVRAHEQFFGDHPEYSLLFHQARGVLQLGQGGVEQLRAVFVRYLRYLAEALDPSATGAPEPDARSMDAAAVVAGTISGYRSFCVAAGRQDQSSSLIATLSGGVPSLLGSSGR